MAEDRMLDRIVPAPGGRRVERRAHPRLRPHDASDATHLDRLRPSREPSSVNLRVNCSTEGCAGQLLVNATSLQGGETFVCEACGHTVPLSNGADIGTAATFLTSALNIARDVLGSCDAVAQFEAADPTFVVRGRPE